MAATTFSEPIAPADGTVVRVRQPVRPRLFDFITLLCLLLLGYAVLGRFFAYISIGPVYIGEVVLAIGVFAFLIHPRHWLIFRSRHMLPLIALMTWGLIRTVPYLNEYGVNALRDAVIWGYACFAILVAARVVQDPSLITRLLNSYLTFAKLFLVVAPVVWMANRFFTFQLSLPEWAGLYFLKSGDLMVHLAGVIAFFYLRLRRASTAWLLLAPVVFAVISSTRAGLLSFLVSLTLLFLVRPRSRRLTMIAVLFGASLTFAVAFDLKVKVPGAARELSVESLVLGVQSVFVDTGYAQFDNTKRWRMQWWTRILDSTFGGDYFWAGRGFGVNLAFVDGIVGGPSDPLRSPHNGHMTILARTGVPGFAIWLTVQLLWLWNMWRRYQICTQRGADSLGRVFLFLIVYWIAFVINATFDVFLEGPMGGIWFWTIFGVGVGLSIAHDRAYRSQVMLFRCAMTGQTFTAPSQVAI